MKTRFIILMLFSLSASRLLSESVTPADIRAGKRVPGSTSPDKKHCLLEVFHDGTTQNSVIFSNADRTGNLGRASLATVWSTDIPYSKRAAILWSPDSTSVALHDSLNKHSVVAIYRHSDSGFASLETPDLLAEACRRWSVDRVDLLSSGQRPLRWDGNEKIAVEVSAKQKSSKKLTTTVHLIVPKEGPIKARME
ncbi:MAG: hypothetical protein ACRDBP_09195 [Luteolibacter sp.]